MTTVDVIGFNCGSMIRKKIPTLPQPSIKAASSNDFGTEPINPVYRNMVIGSEKVTSSRIIAQWVLIPPISMIKRYNGTKMVNAGTIIHEIKNV